MRGCIPDKEALSTFGCAPIGSTDADFDSLRSTSSGSGPCVYCFRILYILFLVQAVRVHAEVSKMCKTIASFLVRYYIYINDAIGSF